jgi:hypothetical protein
MLSSSPLNSPRSGITGQGVNWAAAPSKASWHPERISAAARHAKDSGRDLRGIGIAAAYRGGSARPESAPPFLLTKQQQQQHRTATSSWSSHRHSPSNPPPYTEGSSRCLPYFSSSPVHLRPSVFDTLSSARTATSHDQDPTEQNRGGPAQTGSADTRSGKAGVPSVRGGSSSATAFAAPLLKDIRTHFAR